jgi:hypothetical protein
MRMVSGGPATSRPSSPTRRWSAADLVDEAEVDRIGTSGVWVFLRAYRLVPD